MVRRVIQCLGARSQTTKVDTQGAPIATQLLRLQDIECVLTPEGGLLEECSQAAVPRRPASECWQVLPAIVPAHAAVNNDSATKIDETPVDCV